MQFHCQSWSNQVKFAVDMHNSFNCSIRSVRKLKHDYFMTQSINFAGRWRWRKRSKLHAKIVIIEFLFQKDSNDEYFKICTRFLNQINIWRFCLNNNFHALENETHKKANYICECCRQRLNRRVIFGLHLKYINKKKLVKTAHRLRNTMESLGN